MGRAASLLALAVGLALYYSFHRSLPDGGNWWDVAVVALLLIPACFALVWFALPFRTARAMLPVGISLALLALASHFAGWQTLGNFSKLGSLTALGFWFLGYFETLAWVVLVSAIIPWVDAYSVWRGPTKAIVAHHESVFTNLSFAFPVTGEPKAANLGLPDILFFALFLGAAARFGLRPWWTWLLLTASFGATIAIAVWRDFGGLPALPLLSAGFLLANLDLIWARLRRRGEPQVSPGQP